ncbi:hypothetical protein RRG08_018804 [Elysia crispata]|uniref:Uncharacterized protein n=1 Tax=Elysia crispata TaxID=231223 RepID=A0AAE0ZT25_9GAST|nr:hypothetical protein RRG08_018804 [Elysia crispata]
MRSFTRHEKEERAFRTGRQRYMNQVHTDRKGSRRLQEPFQARAFAFIVQVFFPQKEIVVGGQSGLPPDGESVLVIRYRLFSPLSKVVLSTFITSFKICESNINISRVGLDRSQSTKCHTLFGGAQFVQSVPRGSVDRAQGSQCMDTEIEPKPVQLCGGMVLNLTSHVLGFTRALESRSPRLLSWKNHYR